MTVKGCDKMQMFSMMFQRSLMLELSEYSKQSMVPKSALVRDAVAKYLKEKKEPQTR